MKVVDKVDVVVVDKVDVVDVVDVGDHLTPLYHESLRGK